MKCRKSRAKTRLFLLISPWYNPRQSDQLAKTTKAYDYSFLLLFQSTPVVAGDNYKFILCQLTVVVKNNIRSTNEVKERYDIYQSIERLMALFLFFRSGKFSLGGEMNVQY